MSTLMSRLYSWATDKINSVKITASRQDDELNQIIASLNRKVLCAASAPSSPIAGQTWVDTTNKLFKVYINNEWVIHGPVHIGASAAGTPFEGMLWYDSTNDLLKSYTGAAWQTVLNMPSGAAPQDIITIGTATSLGRLGIGTAGQILQVSTASAPAWTTPGYALSSVRNYSTNTATYATVNRTALIVCYGRVSIADDSSKAITNLPFTSSATYTPIVSLGEADQDDRYAAKVGVDSGSQFTIYNTSGETFTFYWIAVGY